MEWTPPGVHINRHGSVSITPRTAASDSWSFLPPASPQPQQQHQQHLPRRQQQPASSGYTQTRAGVWRAGVWHASPPSQLSPPSSPFRFQRPAAPPSQRAEDSEWIAASPQRARHLLERALGSREHFGNSSSSTLRSASPESKDAHGSSPADDAVVMGVSDSTDARVVATMMHELRDHDAVLERESAKQTAAAANQRDDAVLARGTASAAPVAAAARTRTAGAALTDTAAAAAIELEEKEEESDARGNALSIALEASEKEVAALRELLRERDGALESAASQAALVTAPLYKQRLEASEKEVSELVQLLKERDREAATYLSEAQAENHAKSLQSVEQAHASEIEASTHALAASEAKHERLRAENATALEEARAAARREMKDALASHGASLSRSHEQDLEKLRRTNYDALLAHTERARTEQSEVLEDQRKQHERTLEASEEAANARHARLRKQTAALQEKFEDATRRWTKFRQERERALTRRGQTTSPAPPVDRGGGGAPMQHALVRSGSTAALAERKAAAAAEKSAAAAWEEARRHYDDRITKMKEVSLRLVAEESERVTAELSENMAERSILERELTTLRHDLGTLEHDLSAARAQMGRDSETLAASRNELTQTQTQLVAHASRTKELEKALEAATAELDSERDRWRKLFKLQTRRLQQASHTEVSDARGRYEVNEKQVASLTELLKDRDHALAVAQSELSNVRLELSSARSLPSASSSQYVKPAAAASSAAPHLAHLQLCGNDDDAGGHPTQHRHGQPQSLLSASEQQRIATIDRRLAAIEAVETVARIESAVAEAGRSAESWPTSTSSGQPPLSSSTTSAYSAAARSTQLLSNAPPPHQSRQMLHNTPLPRQIQQQEARLGGGGGGGIGERMQTAAIHVRSDLVQQQLEMARVEAEVQLRAIEKTRNQLLADADATAARHEAAQRRLEHMLVVVATAATARRPPPPSSLPPTRAVRSQPQQTPPQQAAPHRENWVRSEQSQNAARLSSSPVSPTLALALMLESRAQSEAARIAEQLRVEQHDATTRRLLDSLNSPPRVPVPLLMELAAEDSFSPARLMLSASKERQQERERFAFTAPVIATMASEGDAAPPHERVSYDRQRPAAGALARGSGEREWAPRQRTWDADGRMGDALRYIRMEEAAQGITRSQ